MIFVRCEEKYAIALLFNGYPGTAHKPKYSLVTSYAPILPPDILPLSHSALATLNSNLFEVIKCAMLFFLIAFATPFT